MIYIRDYKAPSKYISSKAKRKKAFYNCINYDPFIGRNIRIYTTSGIAFTGILVHNCSRYIVLVIKIGNCKNRLSLKAVILKSSIVALAYYYI